MREVEAVGGLVEHVALAHRLQRLWLSDSPHSTQDMNSAAGSMAENA